MIDDEIERNEILKELVSVSHSHIERSIPTFCLITSLDSVKLSTFIIDAKRPLSIITLPFIEEKQNVADKLHEYITSLVKWEHKAERELFDVITYFVYQVGDHFRGLEEHFKMILSLIVPDSLLPDYPELKDLRKSKDICQYYQNNPLILIDVINIVPILPIDNEDDRIKLIAFVNNIFINELMINNESTNNNWYDEFKVEIQTLLSSNIIFVRERHHSNVNLIKLHVSLPFLFDCWKNDAKTLKHRAKFNPKFSIFKPSLRAHERLKPCDWMKLFRAEVPNLLLDAVKTIEIEELKVRLK